MPLTWTVSLLSRHRGEGGPFCIDSRGVRELDGAGEIVSIWGTRLLALPWSLTIISNNWSEVDRPSN